MDLDAVKIYGTIIRDVAIVGTIDTGRKHMHIMPCYSEASAQSMHGIDRPAIAIGRDIGRSDVENSHVFRSNDGGTTLTRFLFQWACVHERTARRDMVIPSDAQAA